MSNATMTLPLKLYRNQTSQDIHNQIAKEIGNLTPALAERPDRAVDYANGIQRLRGQAETLEYLEKEFYAIVHWGVDNGWTMQQVLLSQYDEVLGLSLRSLDDSSSGRSGDGRRSYGDGRREVLLHVQAMLRHSEWFPGNETKAGK